MIGVSHLRPSEVEQIVNTGSYNINKLIIALYVNTQFHYCVGPSMRFFPS